MRDHPLAVLVVAYQSSGTLPSLVASLGRLGVAVRVLIHDNSPLPLEDQELSALRRAAADLDYFHCPANCGFARGVNECRGRAGRARELLILNPDTRIISAPVAWAKSGSVSLRFDVSAPRVLTPDGAVSRVFGRSRTYVDEALRRIGFSQPEPKGRGYVSGAAMLCSAELFDSVGGIPSEYFMYYEDIEFCRRVNDVGGSVGVDPQFVIEHIGGYSATSDVRAAWERSFMSGLEFHRSRTGGAAYGWKCFGLLDGVWRTATSLARRDSVRLRASLAFVRFVWRTW